MPAGKSELGMGIHGEHGVATLDTQNSREIVQQLTQRLLSHLGDSSDLLLMINNLGGFSALELAILSQELLSSPLGKRVSYLQGPATLVSALDMKGVSLTVLPLTPQLLAALQAPVEVSGWSPVYTPSQLLLHQAAPLPANSSVPPSENAQTAAILVSSCQALLATEQ